MYKAVQFNTATNLLDTTAAFDPSLINPTTPPTGTAMTAKGSITNGNLVSLVNSSGTLQAVNASAAASCSQVPLPANGFVLASYTNGQPVVVYLAGLISVAITGATVANIGANVFLSGTTPGGMTLTAPIPNKVWAASTVYSPGDVVIDSNGNWETTSGGGTSGASNPAWTTTCGNTTTDNTVTWTMAPPALEQIVGTIVYFNAGTNLCTVDFEPFLNVGNVSSVGLAMPADFSVGGSPIVTAGTFSVLWVPQNANVVHAGPATGSAAAPTWRALVGADIPAASNSVKGGVVLTNDLGGTSTAPTVVGTHLASPLPVAQGGTGANLTSTGGAGQVLMQSTVGGAITVGTVAGSAGGGVNSQTGTTYTLQASDLGKLVTFSNTSPVAVSLASGLGSTFWCSISNLNTGAVTLTPASGTIDGSGTLGLTAQFQGINLFTDGTNWETVRGISSGGGGGSGTVTSVAFTGDGVIFASSVPGSPITVSGTLAPTLNTVAAHAVLIGPSSGSAVAPTYRGLLVSDMPTAVVDFSVAAFAPGTGTSNQKLMRIGIAQAVKFPSGAANSIALASANATSNTTFTLKQNGSSFATILFTAGTATGTFTQASDANFVATDLLEIDGPASPDGTLADVGITLAGIKQ